MNQEKDTIFLTELEKNYQNGELTPFHDQLYAHKDKMEKWAFHEYLGLFYFQKGDYPLTRFHMEKSIILGRKTPEIQKVLHQVEKTLFQKNKEVPLGFLGNFYFQIQLTDILLGFAIISLGLISYFGKIWAYRIKKNIHIGKYLFVLFIGIGITLHYHEMAYPAIALKSIPLHSGPSAVYSKVGLIPPGQKLVIKKDYNNWAYIMDPKIYQGWIKQKNLGLLPKK